MMTPSLLQQYLDCYERASGSLTLGMTEKSTLNHLRMLSKSLQREANITAPIQKLVSPLLSTKTWNTQNCFEQLITLLSGRGNAEQQREFLVSEEEHFLNELLHEVQSNLGGTFNIISSGGSLEVKFNGPLTMKYSIFMALLSSKLIAQQHLDTQHIDGEVHLQINFVQLKELMHRSKNLTYTKQSLIQLGLDISTGSKTCEQSLSQNPAYQSRNDLELKRDFGISLSIADALAATPGQQLLFPLTLKITTASDTLMEQLESYYAHPLVNLNSRDGKRKRFIEETRASGLLHESVLNLTQLNALNDFFERMAFFSNYYGKPANQITESEIDTATQHIYKKINEKSNELVTGQRLDIRSFCERTTSRGQITIEAFEQALKRKCTAEMIPGAELFIDSSPFVQALLQIQNEIFQTESFTPWPTFIEEYATAPNCHTPRSPMPIHHYTKAIASYTLTSSKQGIPQEGLAWLNKTISRQMYGSSANQHYLDFYTNNNAYALLDSLISCVKTCLDHPRCTEQHVERILALLGVTEDSMNFYRNTSLPQGPFNRFQIKLLLTPLTLQALSNQRLLQNFNQLRTRRDPWVSYSTDHTDTCVATTIKDWAISMIGWKTANAINGLSWISSNEKSTSAERTRAEEETQRARTAAGGSASDTRRAEKAAAERTTVNYGRCG